MGTFRHVKYLPDPGEELPDLESVEVLHGPVIIHDPELIVREQDGEKEVVFLVPPVPGVSLCALIPDAGGGGGPVVAVGDVERPNRSEPREVKKRHSKYSYMTRPRHARRPRPKKAYA